MNAAEADELVQAWSAQLRVNLPWVPIRNALVALIPENVAWMIDRDAFYAVSSDGGVFTVQGSDRKTLQVSRQPLDPSHLAVSFIESEPRADGSGHSVQTTRWSFRYDNRDSVSRWQDITSQLTVDVEGNVVRVSEAEKFAREIAAQAGWAELKSIDG